MSQEAISTALHAANNSGEPRLIAKSSNMIWPVWRMLKTLRPITCGAIARMHSATTRLLAVRDIGLAPAVKPVLGFDAAEQQILRTAGAEDKALDARDFHIVISRDNLGVGMVWL